MNLTTLTAILLGSAVCGLAQQAQTGVRARHVIGLENVKRNSAGKLTIQNGVMQFKAGTTDARVPVASIDDLSVGSETTQAGGKAGIVAKAAATGAAPYDSGAVLSLLLRTKVDILTVSYRDSGGALHAAILALPKNQAEQERAQLIAAGARGSAAGQEPKETKPVVPAARKADSQRLSASAIQIEPVETGDVRIPAEFRSAIYEFLVERVREAGTFQHVFRSGDRAAAMIPDLVTLHTTVEKFKEGSQMKREITVVLGATEVNVSASVTAGDGQTLMDSHIQGKVRFFGENLGATNDLAKRIAKLLRTSFGT